MTKPWVVKKIVPKKDKQYLNHLMSEVEYLKTSGEKYDVQVLGNVPKNIALADKPNKDEAISVMRTRLLFREICCWISIWSLLITFKSPVNM